MRGTRIEAIPGAPPDLASLPAGCSFAPRCKHARDECRLAVPGMTALAPAHAAACVLLQTPAETGAAAAPA
jgi:peptide/nickel transport system ATP-binding protein